MNKLEKYKDILFGTLSEITSLIIAGNDKPAIFQRLIDCCIAVLEAERVYLLELQEDRVIRYSKSRAAGEPDELRIEHMPKSVLKQWVIQEGQERGYFQRGGELAIDLSRLADQYLEDHGANRTIISAPLVAKKSIFGLLVTIHPVDGGIYAPEDVKLVTVLANQAAIALENQLLYQKLEVEAITDGLTSVYNYRFLMNSLETELKRAKRFGQVFSFVMVDVDNLKEYNDTLGHLSGSQALKEIAQLIKDNSREIDLVSKYGGDEFAILLPQTNLVGASNVSRRVIDAIANHRFDGRHAGLLTCSAGVSCFPQDGATARELIASADKALYLSKRSGKNRVLTTTELSVSAAG